MLSVKMKVTPADAGGYYGVDDYYLESKGYWYGNAEMTNLLELSGDFNHDDFPKLLWGYYPKGGEQPISIVENSGQDNRRGGTDFTFSAPKFVSILSFQDERIRKAFDTAVQRSLDYVESFIQVRHKRNGVVSIEKTGKAVFAVFNHATTRPPEEDETPDPQLHAHCVMANLTVDSEGRFRCIHNPFTPEMIPFLGQRFRNELAKEIQKLEDYQIYVTDRTEGFFDIKIKGISQEEIAKDFSSRSEQIEEKCREYRKLRYKNVKDKTKLKEWAIERVGTTDPDIVEAEIEILRNSDELVYAKWTDTKLKCLATIDTRKPKNKDIGQKDIIERVNETLKEKRREDGNGKTLTLESLTALAHDTGRREPPPAALAKNAIEAILNVIEEKIKTEVAFTKEGVLREAMKSTIGSTITPEDINKEFDRLIETPTPKIAPLMTKATDYGETAYYSTPELMEIERQNVETCVNAKTTDIAVDNRIVDEYIDQTHKNLTRESTDRRGFTQGQMDAIRHILTTDRQYSVIQGDAGTGKSFSLRYAKELLEAQGYNVLGIAPTGKATDELTASAEIETTMTIAALINAKNKPLEQGKKYCIFVDEMSMGDSRTVNKLLKITEEYGAKVIFVGDKEQFLPVGAGRFFADLQKADIKITRMKDVIRQKTKQTINVVNALANKEIPAAINCLAGYTAVIGYDKTNAKKYRVGQRISFHDRTATANSDATVPSGTTAHVTAVGNSELTIEYTVRGQKNIVNIDPRKTHKNYTLYEKNKGYKDCLYTIADTDARQQAVADDYVNCYRKGTDAIVITATNEDRRSLNKIIRETLVRQEKIRNVGDFTLLEPKNVKNFLFVDSFAVGQQIKGLPQLKTDGVYGFGEITNIDINQNKITVRNPKTNEEFKVAPSDYVKKPFSVFDKTESALGIGEKITFLKNARVTDQNTGKTVNLRNGQLAAITELDKEGNITVKVDKKEVKFNLNDYNYITTAFALSLHKSQGMTVDKVIWHADTSKEVSTNSFYVAITRCKRDIAVYTDDIERLQIKAAKGQDKYSTIDFDEVYDKAYQKHIKTIQRRDQKDVAPIPTIPEAAPSAQETMPPPTAPEAVPPTQEAAPPETVKPQPKPEVAPPPTLKDKWRQQITKNVYGSKFMEKKLRFEDTPWMVKNSRWLFSKDYNNTEKEINENYTVNSIKANLTKLNKDGYCNVAVINDITKKEADQAKIGFVAINDEDNELWYAYFKKFDGTWKNSDKKYRNFDSAVQAAKHELTDKIYKDVESKRKQIEDYGEDYDWGR